MSKRRPLEVIYPSVRQVLTPAAATVSAISPAEGPIDGGTPVVLTGTNFRFATGVTIGGVACTDVHVENQTRLSCVVPAGVAGDRDVVVTSGSGNGTLSNGFNYFAPVTLASAAPGTGTHLGGTAFSLVGTGFLKALTVKFGGADVTSFVIVSDISITGVSQAHAAGTVDVVVDAGSYGAATLSNGWVFT